MSPDPGTAGPKSDASGQKQSYSSLVQQVERSYSLAVQAVEKSAAEAEAEAEAKVVFEADAKVISRADRKDSGFGAERPVQNLVTLRRLGITVEVEAGIPQGDVVKARKEHFARDLRKQCEQKMAEPDPEAFIDEDGNVIDQ